MPKTAFATIMLILFSLFCASRAAAAPCSSKANPLNAPSVTAFTKDPAALLLPGPNAEKWLLEAAQVYGQNADSLSALVGIIPKATLRQRTAIGKGLAAAYKECLLNKQREQAKRILDALGNVSDDSVIHAFRSAQERGSNDAEAPLLPPGGDDESVRRTLPGVRFDHSLGGVRIPMSNPFRTLESPFRPMEK
ncbi:MAG: hypothetical protein WAK01_18240 [Methylocystis sp.]